MILTNRVNVINKIITTLILFMILATSVVPVGVSAQGAAEECATKFPSNADAQEKCYQDAKKAQQTTPQKVSNGDYSLSLASFIIDGAAQFIGGFLQRISGFFLLISGLLFDGIINYTVKDMSTNLGTESGIGGSIQSAWSTLRDISNMVFIFVLLYTAFSYMFNVGSGNIGSNIAWIIVIALVINFSLFFSRVIIDASNVVSLGFYRAIENAGGYTLNLQNNPNATATANTTPQLFSGISGGYMRMLGIHSFWSPNINIGGPVNILMLGIMSAVFVFIVAVILLIASIMFVSRFVILIFIMILSPVAFVMFIIPGMKGKFDEWWKALINQSFFAPVFFGLTWVVFKLGMNENFLNGVREQNVVWGNIVTSPSSITGLIINYFIVIGLSIFALSVSKGMAKSVSQFASVSTAIGTAAIGTAAWAGRNTIGRKALNVSNNKELRDAAAAGNMTARMKLWAAGKTAERSFDVRAIGGTGVGKALGLDKSMDSLGKAGGKDGFRKAVEEKAKAKTEYAKKYYGQTVQDTELSKTAESEYNKLRLNDETRIKEERDLEIKKNEEEIERIEKEIEENNKKAQASSGSLEKQKEYTDKIRESRNRLSEIKNINSDLKKKKEKNKFDDSEYSEDTKKKKTQWESNRDAGKTRMKDFAERIKSGPLGIGFIGRMQGNQEAARKIEEAAEGKDKKKPKDLMKELGRLVGVDDEDKNKVGEGNTEENKTNTDNTKTE